jgi:hypothetical protein
MIRSMSYGLLGFGLSQLQRLRRCFSALTARLAAGAFLLGAGFAFGAGFAATFFLGAGLAFAATFAAARFFDAGFGFAAAFASAFFFGAGFGFAAGFTATFGFFFTGAAGFLPGPDAGRRLVPETTARSRARAQGAHSRKSR